MEFRSWQREVKIRNVAILKGYQLFAEAVTECPETWAKGEYHE